MSTGVPITAHFSELRCVASPSCGLSIIETRDQSAFTSGNGYNLPIT